MGAVNPTLRAAADLHQEHGFSPRIGFVILEMGDDAQTRSGDFFAGVALLASFGRGDQPIRFHRRFDGPGIVVEDDAHELARACHLTANPA
jgi:hypothetical protein